EEQAPQEFRDRQQYDRAEIGDRLAQRAAHVEQIKAPGEPERGGDDHRKHGKLDRRRHGFRDEAFDRAAKVDRGAEIAGGDVLKPDQILLRQRTVEAHFLPLALDLGESRGRRQRHGGGIDRQQAQHAEQQRRDDRQNRQRDERAADDEAEGREGHYPSPAGGGGPSGARPGGG